MPKKPNPEDPRAKARKQAQDLIARAVDKGATEEEARTSALVAARAIHEHDLLRELPRHPLFDRLKDLDDDALDDLAQYVEQYLEGAATLDPHIARLESADVGRWRAESRLWQRRLKDQLATMRWVLEDKSTIGVCDRRSATCLFCRRRIVEGDLAVWRKRHRAQVTHFACCVVEYVQGAGRGSD